jgi:hypothetical protein
LPFREKVINNRYFYSQTLYLSAFAPSFPALFSLFPHPFTYSRFGGFGGAKKTARKKQKTEKKNPEKPKINSENNQKKNNLKTKQKTPKISPKNEQAQAYKSLKSKKKAKNTRFNARRRLGASGGDNCAALANTHFTPPLRQAAPRQPLIKPLKIKNIIPLKAGQKEAKNVPPTAGTGKRKKPIERIKNRQKQTVKPLKTKEIYPAKRDKKRGQKISRQRREQESGQVRASGQKPAKNNCKLLKIKNIIPQSGTKRGQKYPANGGNRKTDSQASGQKPAEKQPLNR